MAAVPRHVNKNRGAGARNFKPVVHLDRAQRARLEGESEARKRELESALRLFRETKAPIRVHR